MLAIQPKFYDRSYNPVYESQLILLLFFGVSRILGGPNGNKNEKKNAGNVSEELPLTGNLAERVFMRNSSILSDSFTIKQGCQIFHGTA
jgi:hypothetical protein